MNSVSENVREFLKKTKKKNWVWIDKNQFKDPQNGCQIKTFTRQAYLAQSPCPREKKSHSAGHYNLSQSSTTN